MRHEPLGAKQVEEAVQVGNANAQCHERIHVGRAVAQHLPRFGVEHAAVSPQRPRGEEEEQHLLSAEQPLGHAQHKQRHSHRQRPQRLAPCGAEGSVVLPIVGCRRLGFRLSLHNQFKTHALHRLLQVGRRAARLVERDLRIVERKVHVDALHTVDGAQSLVHMGRARGTTHALNGVSLCSHEAVSSLCECQRNPLHRERAPTPAWRRTCRPRGVGRAEWGCVACSS